MSLIKYSWEKENFYTEKNYLKDLNRLEIKKDIIKEIKENDYSKDNTVKYQTQPDLHTRLKGKHWNSLKKKISKTVESIGKYELYRCWANYINNDSEYFLHTHKTSALAIVYYVENPSYQYGTYIKKNNKEIIILGYQNSIQIFNPNLLHELVFPPKEVLKNNPRISIAFDYKKR
tara:strand:- start:43 stop:567 length:525 start_codon:yes stop_codon:yes gene_type:complete